MRQMVCVQQTAPGLSTAVAHHPASLEGQGEDISFHFALRVLQSAVVMLCWCSVAWPGGRVGLFREVFGWIHSNVRNTSNRPRLSLG